MTRQQAIELAQKWAKEYAPSYYEEPFMPHEWVIVAIQAAFGEGYDEGYGEGYGAGVREEKGW